MLSTPERRQDTLRHARALLASQAYAGIALSLGELGRADLLAEPELGFLLATAWRRMGETGRALEMVEALLEPCARRGRDRLWRRRLNLEGALHLDVGEMEAAQGCWSELLASATAAGDDELTSMASNNLGIVLTLQGRWDEALASYNRAATACQRMGDRLGLARAHQNLGITYRELGFLAEADAHFQSAGDHGKAVDADDVVGRAEEERAVGLLLAGDPDLAEATARRALQRFTRLGDPLGQGEARRVLGIIALARGDVVTARRELEAALETARETGAALLEAEVLEALAAVELEDGDDAAAAFLQGKAATSFEAMGAAAWGRQLRARMAAFAQRHGAPPTDLAD